MGELLNISAFLNGTKQNQHRCDHCMSTFFQVYIFFSILKSVNSKVFGFLYCNYWHPTAHLQYGIFEALVCRKPSDAQCIWCISGAPEYSVVTAAWLCQTHWTCKIIDSLHRCMISGITEVYQSWGVCICGNSRSDAFQTLKRIAHVPSLCTCIFLWIISDYIDIDKYLNIF